MLGTRTDLLTAHRTALLTTVYESMPIVTIDEETNAKGRRLGEEAASEQEMLSALQRENK